MYTPLGFFFNVDLVDIIVYIIRFSIVPTGLTLILVFVHYFLYQLTLNCIILL